VAELKPVYLVHGDDDVKLDAWRRRVRARADAEGAAATLDLLSGDASTPAALAAATAALTLSTGRRYLLADGVERWKEKDLEPLKAALADLPPDTIVVMLGRGKVMKGKGPAPEALVKAVTAARGEVQVCEAPRDRAYPRWIADHGRELGLALTDDAAQALLERAARDDQRKVRPQHLLRELEKLACYAPEDGRVDRDTVEALTVTDVEARAYELAEAVIERERGRALAVAEDLRDRGEDIMHILFALLRQLRQCRRAWAMLEAGKSKQEIQSALRVPQFVARQVAARAERADGEHLERALHELAELDYAVRGGGNLETGTALTLALNRAAA
jgi:DNA polymerase III subunit delta